MRPPDRARGRTLDNELRKLTQDRHPLPGIRSMANREAFVEQVVESIRRVEFIAAIAKRDISDLRTDPSSDLFDPIKAAMLYKRRGQIDEAFWLTFLSVHFGKHKRTGWRLIRDVYGSLGTGTRWDWATTSANPKALRQWLATNETVLRGGDGVERHFGNHHKYQSLSGTSATGTGAAIESYVKWICPPRTHEIFIRECQKEIGENPRELFDHLYHSMSQVISFGRMAKFDFLTMIGKIGLAAIEPGSPYLDGSTGPLAGARLLFSAGTGPRPSCKDLDLRSVELGNALGVGMQVVEDALCNWQKSPSKFVPFRG